MAAIITASVVNGLFSADAAGTAADAQRDAANTASRTQLDMYNQNRADMQPWRDAGTVALGQLGAGTSNGGDLNRDFSTADFQQDPGYAFRQQQGMNALQSSAAARGGLMNGGTLKALDRYTQDYASQEYQNAYNRFNADRDRRFNRLASVAGIGQTATRDVANMGQNTAAAVAGNQLAAGNAASAGAIGRANAITGAIGNAGSMYALNNGGPFNGGYSGPGSSGWDFGGFNGTNDRGAVNTGSNSMDWWLRNGTGGD